MVEDKIEALISKGVNIPQPQSIFISEEVEVKNISGRSVTLYPGTRIYGKDTIISDGVNLGYEGPLTIYNCQIGRECRLSGGILQGSTFLKGVKIGPEAHVREGCLLEEYSRCAHCVGIKHTILFPYVTLGSLINFCDCLMAGGRDRKNHSEVGSSYIHFNYTPNQDKATATLIGDVPRGVMLDQPPIFLGGQGGIVGPVRIEFGVVVAAGVIVRKDLLKSGRVYIGSASIQRDIPLHPLLYSNIKRILRLNINYISNLISLRRWYLDVRYRFIDNDPLEKGILIGAVKKIDMAIDERVRRLREIAEKMPDSIRINREIRKSEDPNHRIKELLFERWAQIEDTFSESRELSGDISIRDRFLEHLDRGKSYEYIDSIKSLSEDARRYGTQWLKGIVEESNYRVFSILDLR